MLTDEVLTRIYNEASGLEPPRYNPITTRRAFAAMRAIAAAELEACLEIVAKYETVEADYIYKAIEMRLDALAPRREGNV